MTTEMVKHEYVPACAVVTEALPLAQSSERMKRAALARLTLGYEELALAVGEIRPKVSEQQVAEGLKRAGVGVFDNKAVSAHKRRFRMSMNGRWGRGSWVTQLISEYGDPIPEFAIDTALKVKEALPEAKFFIEHYVSGWGDDPFLSFLVPGLRRRFVVEVWDEPDFEAEKKEA